MKPFWCPALLFSLTLALVAAPRDPDEATRELVGFDKRREHRIEPAAEQEQAHENLKSRVPQVAVDFDSVLASPRWIRAREGKLTGEDGRGKSVSAETAERFRNDPDRAIKGFVHEH